MGLLKTFFNQDPEKTEQRGDAFLKASDWGRAKLEFEKALDALEKTSSDDASETRLRGKLVQAKGALIKRRFADISFALGRHSSAIMEMYLSLVQDDPENAQLYFQKISRIYASMGNEEEARRFRVFAQQAENGKG